MILTENVKNSLEAVIKAEAEVKKLQETIKAEKENIRKFLNEAGETSLKQDGYYANIAEGTRNTLQAKEVEKLLGYEIPAACYKTTNYTTLTIKRMELV